MRLAHRLGAAVAVATLAVATGLAVPGAQSVQQPPSEFALGQTIPFDPAVRSGTLPNGLRYFVRQNREPANRLLLRLAVKAGSIDEADDQQGLAHFIEHMAFNGTEHFKPGELVSYFESTGTQLGPHVNAYTGFEETVYMLDVPTDVPEIISKGFIALADFAGGVTFDPEQVERERGVVIEEWRGRLGAGSRISDQQLPILYHQSRYAARLPIGKPEVIRGAPVERLRAFYDAWYRPDRMAVVAVGDVEPNQLEASIRSAFGSMAPRTPAEPRQEPQIPPHDELLVSIAADPEVTQSSLQVVRKRPSQGQDLVGDYRRQIAWQLFSHMFNERLGDLVRSPDAAFLAAGLGSGSLSPAVDSFSLSARVPDGSVIKGLTALLVEAKRVGTFGFHQSELDRAKRSIVSFYERAYNERDKTASGSYAREYVSHFLSGEPSPGIEYEHRLVSSVMPGITLDEVAALGRGNLESGSPVVLVVSPARAGLAVPSTEDITGAIASASAATVTPWAESSTATALMEKAPEPGAISSERSLPDVGITVVRFANGAEAWLKPTDFKNDQIVFTMYAMGGASLAPPSGFINATLAPSLVELSGAGGLSAPELERLLAGRPASASPFLSLSTHGVSGSATPAELETALQLLYQVVTEPGSDAESFALLKRQLSAMLANRGQSPGQVFGERVAFVNSAGHYTVQPLTLDDVLLLDQDRMLSYYRERFSNAADFTFFMAGAFEPRQVLPLLARYLGSLPSTGVRRSQFQDLQIRFPDKIQQEIVRKGQEPRSNTVISFFADPSPGAADQEQVVAAITVLETTMRDLLREDLGQTYSVSVGLAQSLPQRGAGHIQVRFGAAPENIQAMTDRVLAEVRRLQAEGPSTELTASAKETARRTYETSLKQNAYWMRRMQTIHMLGGNPTDIITREARIQAVTPAVLQDAFKRYFPLDRYTVVTLVPEAPNQP